MSDRTEIHWTYDPPDFFEVDQVPPSSDYCLTAKDGDLVAALSIPQYPVPKDLDERIREHVTLLFRARRLQNRRSYTLQGPRIEQHRATGKTICVDVTGAACLSRMGEPDVIQYDLAGNVTRDTRKERIARLETLVLAAQRSPVLAALLVSLEQADSDSANALVHMYEIRDALTKHFGSGVKARAALAISRREWDWLGKLANREPIREGRHRGEHYGNLRDATTEELDKVRKIVTSWVEAFAATV